MDYMTIKKELKIPTNCFNVKAENAIDVEFSMPDYCPKIDRIVNCIMKPRISNLSYAKNSVTADGTVDVSILYSTAENELFGYETELQFSKTADVHCELDKSIVNAKAVTSYVNCRAVNERKLDIHGAVTIDFSGNYEQGFDVVCDAETNDLKMLKKSTDYLKLCGAKSKLVVMEQEYNLPQTSGNIENIIKTDASINILDCKFVADNAIVKAELCFEILYRNTDKKCETFCASIPIEQMIDVDNAKEGCIKSVNADICSFKIKPFTDTDGECKTVNVLAKISFDVIALSNEKFEYVEDCYSINNELSVDKCSAKICTVAEEINQSHQIREVLGYDENSLCKVIDVNMNTSDIECSFDDEQLNISGILNVMTITENDNGELIYIEKAIDFKHKVNANSKFNGADVYATVDNCSYSIKSKSDLEIRAQINVGGLIYCCEQVSLMTNISIDETAEKIVREMPEIVMYFAKSGERIWNIAMRYNTGPELIMKANDLADDLLSEDKVLMIPSL